MRFEDQSFNGKGGYYMDMFYSFSHTSSHSLIYILIIFYTEVIIPSVY